MLVWMMGLMSFWERIVMRMCRIGSWKAVVVTVRYELEGLYVSGVCCLYSLRD